jgi:TolA-binding protein
LNWRLFLITAVLLALLAGGFFGWRWYSTRPDYLYASALDYYQKAEQALKTEDVPRARSLYESARTQLVLLLDDPKRAPNHWQGHLLRYKVSSQLAQLGQKENPQRSVDLAVEARRSGVRAAENDPASIEAQALMVDHFMRSDELDRAEPYAQRLIALLPEDAAAPLPDVPELGKLESYLDGAYFLAARAALRGPQPRPDEALELSRKLIDLDRKTTDPGMRTPRWRTVELEVHALKLKAAEAARARAGARPRVGAEDPEEQLQAKINEYMNRVRTELQEVAPGTPEAPGQSVLLKLSTTNVRGLLAFLLIGVESCPNGQVAAERANVMLDVCDKLTGKEVPQHILQEATRHLALLPFALSRLPRSKQPIAKAQEDLGKRLAQISSQAESNNASIDPATYLEMAYNAHKTGDFNRAVDLAGKGLKIAEARGAEGAAAAPLSEVTGRLHAQAAAALMLQGKAAQADKEHLAALAKEKQFLPVVNYLQGLAAVLDGRLEDGVQKLEQARKNTAYAENTGLMLALGNAYMGQGKYARALPLLEKLQELLKRREQNPEDKRWIGIFLPDPDALTFDLFRCHLALSTREDVSPPQRKAHAARSEEYRAALKGKPLGPTADSTLITALVTQSRLIRPSNPLVADDYLKNARAILDAYPQAARDDVRLVSAELNLILAEPEANPLTLASAAVLPLGAPGDLPLRLAQNARLQGGLSWHLLKAEQLMNSLAGQKDAMQAQLVWIRWLWGTGRQDEAITALQDLEKTTKAPEMQRRLKAFQAMLELNRGKSEEARNMLQELGKEGTDLPTDIVHILERMARGDKSVESDIKNALARHQQAGLLYYWQGQVQQANGKLLDAIQAYERALEYQQFRGASQIALYNCVAALITDKQGGVDMAAKEISRLVAAHPDNPTLLLAYSALARLMDNLHGKDGMAGALARMQELLVAEGRSPAVGAYLAAIQWNAAGRPDLARAELQKGIQASPSPHFPSLLMLTQLALAEEDWVAAEKLIDSLSQVQPDSANLKLWRGAVQVALGETDKARKTYEEFVASFPALSNGYLALAGLAERNKDYRTALDWVKKWRDKSPDDLSGFRAHVRILARDGQVKEAEKLAEDFLKEQRQKVQEQLARAEQAQPARDDKEKEQRAKDRGIALANAEWTVLMNAIGAFQEAEVFDRAEAWITQRALPHIDKLARDVQKANRDTVQLILGTLYLEQGRKATDKTKKSQLLAQAIKTYEAVWAESPGNVVAGNNLAWLVNEQEGDPTTALATIDKVRLGPYSRKPISGDRLPVEVLDTLGVIYRAAGKNEDALKLFQEAVQRYRQEPRILLHLGRSQTALRQVQEAYKSLSAAIEAAESRARETKDPERKAKFLELAREAREEQKKLGNVAAAPR